MARNPSISLTPSLQKDIADLIESGRYQNVSEFMRASARILIDREKQRIAVINYLEKAALEGLNSEVVENFDVDAFLAKKYNQFQE